MDKAELRQEMRAERAKLSEEEVGRASQLIFERTIELPQVRDAKIVLVYADFDNEVRTGELTGWLLYNGKKVALPLIDDEDDELDAVPYRGNVLVKTKFGFAAPQKGTQLLDPASVDVVICPGLAFTQSGERLGFGKAYYDQFFARAPQAYRIGLAYSFQVVGDIPAEAHDARVNAVVTPDRVFS